MASEVDICNLAMSWLGANAITSLDDESVEAQICKTNYPLSRDAVTEEREWTFAVSRFILAPMAREPVYGYGYQFLVPSEVIRILGVPFPGSTIGVATSGPDQMPGIDDWRLEVQPEGRVILVQWQVIAIRALVQQVNTGLFSPSFVQALAARIAADTAMPITESNTKTETMWQLYDKKLREAAATDGTQGRMEVIRSNALQRVR